MKQVLIFKIFGVSFNFRNVARHLVSRLGQLLIDFLYCIVFITSYLFIFFRMKLKFNFQIA